MVYHICLVTPVTFPFLVETRSTGESGTDPEEGVQEEGTCLI